MASAHLHDAYYQGRKWQYDFDAKMLLVPGKRYYIKPVVAKANVHVFDFLKEQYSPFKEVPGQNVNWAKAVQCDVCTRDMAGAMFSVAESHIMQSGTVTYPPYYRMLKQHIEKVEASGGPS
jgi:hypothetical protein